MSDENVFHALSDLFRTEEDDEFEDPRAPGIGGSLSKTLAIPPSKRGEFRICGLLNQGATCYLNSLLQAMYMTPELRRGLYAVSPEEMGLEQQEAVERGEEPKVKKPVRALPLELQRLFVELQLTDRSAVSTERLTTIGFQWTANEERQQHDVSELNRMLYTNVESSLKGTSGKRLIQDLYEGKSVSQAQCGVCGSTRGREEVVYSVDVPVKGYPNMVSSLIASTEFEAMTGPNAINCDTCGVKRDSKLGRKLRLLPPILVVNLQRIVFDMEKLDRVKVTDRFEFPLVLDMAPFMENGVLDVLRGTSDGVGGGVEGPLPAQVISDVTSGMIWLSDLTTEAGRESARAKSEALNSRSDLNNVYDLFAVVLHSGSPHSGHYHAYIRDMLGEGNWRVLGGDMTAQSELTSASQAVAAAASAGKPGGPTVTHPDSPLPVLVKLMEGAPVHPTWKLKYMQLDALGTALSGEIHSSWKNVYRKDWGGMKEFLVGQPEYFEIRSQAVVLKTKYPPIEVAEAPVSVPVPPDDDEASVALACQLQAKEDTKKGAARSGAGSAGDEWTVVGTAAKKPVLTEAPAVGKPVVTGATTVLTELAQHWGHWFDFNDSVVTPMSVPALGKAFAGAECGYMLMYRSRALGVGGTPAPISPPERWASKMAEFNKQLHTARATYELLSHQVEVTLMGPSAFGVSPAGQLSLSDTASEHSCKCVVDDRWSVAELRRQLFDSLGPLDPQVVTIGLPFFKINPIRAIGEAGLFHVYEGIGDGADDSMPVSGLKPPMMHGMTLLIWSGSTLDGVDVSIGEDAEPWLFQVTYLSSATVKTSVSVSLPRSSTLVKLKSAIASLVGGGIATSALDVYTLAGGSRRVANKIIDKRVGGSPAKLADLGLKDGMELLAEKNVDEKGKSRSRPLAFDEASKRDKMFDVIVEDRRVPATVYNRLAFNLDRETPLSDLRGLVLSALGVEDTSSIAGGGRFRKSDGLLSQGSLLEDESDTLAQAGLRDGAVLYFEPGRALSRLEMELRYEVYTGNKSVPTGGGGTRVASGELIVPSTTTVEGLKSIILEAAGCAGKDPKQCRLRRTNGFGEGLGRPCESEQVTLVKEGLTNGSLVWVEDGIVLKKGMVLMKMHFWAPECSEAVVASIPAGVFPSPVQPAAAKGVVGFLKSFLTKSPEPVPAPESPTPLDALDYVLRVRKACLLPLPQLTLSDDITLLTLKTQLLSSRALCTARTYALNVSSLSMDRPVTDVEPSEGRCLSDFGITPKHIRVREKGLNNVPGRVLKGDNKTLRNLFVAGMKDYVVEVLSEEETLPDEAIVLWVQHRHPNSAFVGLREPASAPTDARSSSDTMSSVASALCGANTPLWPPQSVIIRGTAKPTYLEFATSLSLQVGIPVDKLRIAKLATGNKKVTLEWKVLQATPSSVGGGGGGGGKGRRKGGKGTQSHKVTAPSVVNAPYSIRDGDILAVANSDEDPEGKDDWMRVEDYCVIAREQAYREMVKLSRIQNRSGGGSSVARARGPEVGLHMGGDYEFPSDSEGEEDGDVAVASSTAAEASGGPSESTTVGAVEEGKSDGKPRSDSDLARELQSQWNA